MPEPQSYTLAAFDFDGTLTRKDSMLAFIRYVRGDWVFFRGMVVLFPLLVLLKLKLVSEQRAKEAMLKKFFGGMSAESLFEAGVSFAREKIPGILIPSAVERLRWHQSQGHICYLVTASLRFWVQAWAESQGLRLIATEPVISGGIFTGKILGKNCKGAEKVRRLNEALTDKVIEKKYAYGDTSGDRAMLAWADEGFYRHFS